MAGRIRSIKPEVLTDEKAASLSHEAWRLWVSMWVLADDTGRLPSSPSLLAGQVFWGQPADTATALAELQRAELVKVYRVRGQTYAAVLGFGKHQRIDRPSPSKFPSPDDATEEFRIAEGTDPGIRRGLDEGSTRARRGLALGKGIGREEEREGDGRGMGGGGVEGEGTCSPPEAAREVAGPGRGRVSLPPEAESLADELREHLVTEKPNHELADDTAWARRRSAWSKAFASLLSAGREAARSSEIMTWVFGDQGGAEFRFRVDSPKALREKWDRIEVAMARSRTPRGTRIPDRARELWELADRLEAEEKSRDS